ncbi:uncharacterized protein LOC117889801 [Drosophila subobscura]|uniref:uncharacterized protein LOC117889801 n=1 Tax=Drosophila subobscura TaxID=7241 RepID=UPI00155A761E|nr:uncharacterized protein LOC117889801 [Drosophila subobscura]
MAKPQTKQLLAHCLNGKYFGMMPNLFKDPNKTIVRETFVPHLRLSYNPLKYYLSKLQLWKLRWTWDRDFRQDAFLEHTKELAVKLTDIVKLRDNAKTADDFYTSNVTFQMASEATKLPHECCADLMRFRRQDIQQALPVNVEMYNIYGLRYAVVDVAMVGLRDVASSETQSDLESMKRALIQMDSRFEEQLYKPDHPMPHVFIELFLRFRRNYSQPQLMSAEEQIDEPNRWIVTKYKICKFHVFTAPPLRQ